MFGNLILNCLVMVDTQAWASSMTTVPMLIREAPTPKAGFTAKEFVDVYNTNF